MRKKYLMLAAAALLLSGCSPKSLPEITLHTGDASTINAPETTSESESTSEEAVSETEAPTSNVPDTEHTSEATTEAVTESEAPATEATSETTTEATTEATSETTTEATTEAPTESETPAASEATTEAPTESEAPLPVTLYVTKRVNVRTAPSTDSVIAAIYDPGTAVSAIGIGPEFTAVDIGGTTFYIASAYLSDVVPETVPPTTSESQTSSEADTSTSAPQPGTEATTEQPTTEQQIQPGGITATSLVYGGVLYTIGNGPTVCIDPGHMGKGSPAKEPNAPGSTEMKARATTGTQGIATGNHESLINLIVSLQLKDELLSRGYNVMMTRESQDVDISNMERALMANSGADISVRIHCNSVNDSNVTGIVTMCPSSANPYLSSQYAQCNSLSDAILSCTVASTGAVNKGILYTDTMSGINWSTIPVTILEMGFMSNPDEDRLLADPAYQKLMVTGTANGIDKYFGK